GGFGRGGLCKESGYISIWSIAGERGSQPSRLVIMCGANGLDHSKLLLVNQNHAVILILILPRDLTMNELYE
ncbi:hypothetical protein, partial [Rhizobium leguminosarum]